MGSRDPRTTQPPGDTLFPGGPGATQTAEDFDQIMESLDTKLFTQSDETLILPGHGPDTTIGREKASNYYLR